MNGTLIALGVSILTLQLGIVGWLLAHSSQCSRLRERVAKLEQKNEDET